MAVLTQLLLLAFRLESPREAVVIVVFHLVATGMELFKTAPGINSWHYPEEALIKIGNVPLFAGFMYSAVGSYLARVWRIFDFRYSNYPALALTAVLAALVYANFFTHHYIGDYRWYIAAGVLGLYARTTVVYQPLDRERRMPLLLGFVLVGFFIWLAENLSTFFGVWRYPNQLGAWSAVHVGKWSSWSLLVIMSFTLVIQLKHVKQRIHVPA